jgi:hypothetical protein
MEVRGYHHAMALLPQEIKPVPIKLEAGWAPEPKNLRLYYKLFQNLVLRKIFVSK